MSEKHRAARLHWANEVQRMKQIMEAVQAEQVIQSEWLYPTTSEEDVPLLRIHRRLARTLFEYNSFLLATVATVDLTIQQWIGEFQGEDKGVFPSFMLCQLLFCRTESEKEEAHWAMRMSSPFLLCFTMRFEYAHSYSFQVEPFLVDAIIKNEHVLSHYEQSISLIETPMTTMFIGQDEAREQLHTAIQFKQRVQLIGPTGYGQVALIEEVVSGCGAALVVIDGKTFPCEEWRIKWEWVMAIIYLYEAIVVVQHTERLVERLDDQAELWLRHPLWSLIDHAVVFCTETALSLPFASYDVGLKPYTYSERRALWKQYSTLTEQQCEDMAYLKLAPRQIVHVASIPHLPFHDRFQLAKRQLMTRLGERAQFICSSYTLADVKLPPLQQKQLQLVVDHYRYRTVLAEKSRIEQRFIYGKGLSLLLSGPPGTGKTMIAHSLANELALDLYRVDLSQLVSKYIGETEKQLASLFTEAEKAHVLLFFDETDALFGKRSEVKEANDKYANLETSYLLQRLEMFDGVSVLATNLAQNIDEAFLRRITYSVHIPLPSVEERRQLWQSFFALGIAVSETVNPLFLAETLAISGGYIKNIYWQAAILAVREQRAMDYSHLAEAIVLEYRKIGKVVPLEWMALYKEELCGITDCIT